MAAATLATVVLLGAGVAVADEADDHVGCFDRREYDACFREGKRQYGADAYEDAYRAYLEGWRLQRNYEVAGNLGNVELELGKHADAYVHLKYSLERLPPSQKKSDIVARLEEKIGEALRHVGARRLEVDPSDAIISIDGSPVETDPELWLALAPGEHSLQVAREGYQTVERVLDVRTGEEKLIEISLGAPVAQDDGGFAAPDEAGDGGISDTKLGVGLGALSVGVGAGVASIILGVTALDRAESVRDLQSLADAADPSGSGCGAGSPLEGGNVCPQLRSFHREEIDFRTAAIVTGAAGGLLVIGGLVYLLLPEDPPETEVGLSLGPSSFGLDLHGRF